MDELLILIDSMPPGINEPVDAVPREKISFSAAWTKHESSLDRTVKIAFPCQRARYLDKKNNPADVPARGTRVREADPSEIFDV